MAVNAFNLSYRSAGFLVSVRTEHWGSSKKGLLFRGSFCDYGEKLFLKWLLLVIFDLECLRLKLIYIVVDGMGDVPVDELGDRTPLEAAETPYMDSLAKAGKTGLMYTVGKGIAPESDVAVVSILGYDPFEHHVSRGALESVGAGLKMRDGDLALRCNFGTLAADGSSIVDRRVGRDLTQEETDELAQAVNGQVQLESCPVDFQIKSTATYRAALVIRSEEKRLSGNISNTDPAYKRIDSVGVADLEDETPVPHRYFKDEEGNHIVPKLTLERLLLGTQ